MKISTLFLSLLSLFFHSTIPFFATCTDGTTSGLIPLDDLGTGTYQGYQGGLYPKGSNLRPEPYNTNGINIANAMHPLDTSGNVDDTNGKYVMACVGYSNLY